MTSRAPSITVPFAVAGLGIALYSVMDGLMKDLSIELGAYNAALWRSLAGVVMTGVIFALRRPRWPSLPVLRLHSLRGVLSSVMVLSFFWGIARVPLAEGIALSFIAPLITLYLAAVLLGETVTRWSVLSSLIALCGVGVILAGRLDADHSAEALQGAMAILFSAVAYSYNLILQRQQAQVAAPDESAFFGTAVMTLSLLLFAPFLAHVPAMVHVPGILGSALFASAAFIALSWAYGRAEAKVLVVLEYTAFIWGALIGYLMFREPVTLPTLSGAALIVLGCLLSAWHDRRIKPAAAA